MPDHLELTLRYNASPDIIKSLMDKKVFDHKQFICKLFAINGCDIISRNSVNTHVVKSVTILEKPFQPYTAFVEFNVVMNEGLASSTELLHFLVSKWSTPDVWLTPKRYNVLSERDFQPSTSMHLELRYFSFGTILDGHKYINCSGKYSDYQTRDAAVVNFSFGKHMLYMYFICTEVIPRLFCLELSWTRDLEKRIIVCEDCKSGTTRMYIQMTLLPKIFMAESFRRGNQMIDSCSPRDYLTSDFYFYWVRKTIFPDCSKEILGNCMTLELVIAQHVDKRNICELLMYLKQFGVEVSYCQTQEQLPVTKTVWNDLFRMSSKNFDVYWALQTFHSRGFQAIETVERVPEFKQLITKYIHDNRGRKQLQKALYNVANLIESERYVNILKAFENYLSFDYKVPMIDYKGLEYVRSVVVTPLRVIFYPTMPVMSNRILREYDAEFCMRVTYRDEDMNKLMANKPDFYDQVVYDHVSQKMTVSDRVYQYLACSNSQLHSHGVWFYSTDNKGVTADLIRSEMGDLSQISNVASYVARMGQCFSTTQRGVTEIESEWLRYIDDVERNGYCFSDGAGMISVELRNEVAKTLGHSPRSLYQIRFGGCKGTVAVNPELEGKQLLIRKSMKKFDSYHNDLEICREADARRLYLNHQSIMLLEQLGVPSYVFLSIQERAMFDLLDMMLYEERAARMIDQRTIPNIKLKPLVQQGVSLITDPFMRNILLLVLHKTIDSIKSNGRIELPLEYARNLMGTMDMTNTLEYGQVFVQYSADLLKKGESSHVLTGDVIITKFPAVHKGDMRRFVARDVPQLHHMVDCIVFPSKGPRPHPDEMAGSDLDGDEYFVTWLPEFLDTFQTTNQDPMDYSSKKKVLDRQVGVTDMYRFITDYIHNDNLGRISNALKVLADTEDEGFFSEKCQTLAQKHSMAVDFPKTEIPVSLDSSESVTKYPDFMGKQGSSWVYNSKRVLGTMYRVCSSLSDVIEECYMNVKGNAMKGKAMVMPNIVIPQDIIDKAHIAYCNYVNGLRDIMHSYGVTSEEELISGTVINLHKRLAERKELYSTVEIVRTMVSQYRGYFRKLFFNELGYDTEPEKLVITEAMRVKAIAWYNQVYLMERPYFYSFAWVVADIIGDIVQTNAPVQQTSTERITESLATVYDNVKGRAKIPGPSERKKNERIETIGREYPAIVALWMFLCLWCQKFYMEYSYVRKQFDVFLTRHCKIDIPILEPHEYNKFTVLMSHVCTNDMKSVVIKNESIGELLLAFLRYHGSQDFVMTVEGTGRELLQASTLHDKSLKAYFHLAVYNDCHELVSTKSRSDTDNQLAINRNIVIPHNVWVHVSKDLVGLKRDIMNVFKGLTTVSIAKHSRGKKPTGAVFVVGFFEDVIALERVQNTWFTKFEPQRSYETDFRRFKDSK